MIRSFIKSQIWLSNNFDEFLSSEYKVDGNQDYISSFVPKYLMKNIVIYDIGGGKNPYLSIEKKKELNATVIGLDICSEELSNAPEGAYDEVIVADISKYQGRNDADLIICQAVLEHVQDVESAFTALSSILKTGGLLLLFLPSRNAIYARLNIILPQNIKKMILYGVYPNTKRMQGFPSFYDKCTPMEIKKISKANRLFCVEERYYFISSYFSFFFPLFFLWRLWIILFRLFFKDQAAESFSFALRKQDSFF